MSRLHIRDCSLDDAGMVAIAASVNKINQLKIWNCSEISVKDWVELAKHINNRNLPVS